MRAIFAGWCLAAAVLPSAAAAQDPIVEVVDTGTNELLTAVAFDGIGRHGWAVGGSAEKGPGVLLTTDDGGATWSEANPPNSARLYGVACPPGGPSPRAVVCGLDGVLWTVDAAGVVVRSHELGLGQSAWLAVATVHPWGVPWVAGSADGKAFVATPGAAANWLARRIPTAATGGSIGIRALTFVTPNLGFASGPSGLLLRTRDAGNTWQRCKIATDAWLKGMSFVDERTGFAVGGPAVVLRTDDGGASWRELPTPVSGKFNGVAFLDPDRGYVIEAGGTLCWTRDGGRSWGMTALEHELTSIWRAADSDLWITCGDGKLLRIRTRPAGSVRGRVLDAEQRPVADASVYVCATSGAPISGDGRHTLGHVIVSGVDDSLAILQVATDAAGRFELELPQGAYRLVAQTWGSNVGATDADARQPLRRAAAELTLRGVAVIDVEGGHVTETVIGPLGTGQAVIEAPVPNDWNVLALSTAAPHTAPILGLAAFGGRFGENLIGGVRMQKGRTLVRGLPTGEVHAAVVQNGNNSSAGFGSISITGDAPVSCAVDLNDRSMPRAIAALERQLDGLDAKAAIASAKQELIWTLDKGHPFRAMFALAERADRRVDLGNGRTARAADLLALDLYRQIRDR